jgi:hypothetical protein
MEALTAIPDCREASPGTSPSKGTRWVGQVDSKIQTTVARLPAVSFPVKGPESLFLCGVEGQYSRYMSSHQGDHMLSQNRLVASDGGSFAGSKKKAFFNDLVMSA